MHAQIGAFDAKTRLSELLRNVQGGQNYTITVRGKPIADLVPSGSTVRQDKRTAVQAMRDIRKIQGVPDGTMTEWVAEGRR
uniref:Prevent-host-death family protein n=1 Tax=Candidatus Kentrum sp. LFY TaxID=2126342 RepID=A0A450UBF2_9GAMM|nr:MAG: prevent-host-death family protein [Candidatus Kentron sp. LFY]VFJ90282.1 MAG: prevent-host-death family protein [Candidatus Kentron sp. LFY]VFK17411.1 MAG: prevent-host-death family protein [Candidatus Kentron sp. LFY]